MSASLVIVGGGPVGLAFALAAARLPSVDVTVVERSTATTPVPAEGYDHRVYALSPASLAFLSELGAAPDPERASAVRAMQVWSDDGKSKLDLAKGPPIATIVEYAAMIRALEHAVACTESIRMLRGAVPQALSTNNGRRELAMQDGSVLAADLLVGADGSRSQIRDWAGISVESRDYESDGVVANFHCQFAHGDVARQWFTNDAVLAYLPLPQQQISIVWSVTKAKSANLKTLSEADFCVTVEAAGHSAVGKLTLASPIARFPLVRMMAHHCVETGLALIGDAAHAVHPLAGQGVNLGIADARALFRMLSERSRFSAIGDLAVLRKYSRARRESTIALGEGTHNLLALYKNEGQVARWLRNDGLSILNHLPHAKAALIDYATS